MTDDQIKALANFLGGPNQVGFSILLSMGGGLDHIGREFFKLRDTFNVQGYASVPEAEAQIRKAMS